MTEEVDGLNPAGAERAIWGAIRECLAALPPERRTVEEIEPLFWRLAEQAFRELREEVEQEVMGAAFAELDEAPDGAPGAASDGGR